MIRHLRIEYRYDVGDASADECGNCPQHGRDSFGWWCGLFGRLNRGLTALRHRDCIEAEKAAQPWAADEADGDMRPLHLRDDVT